MRQTKLIQTLYVLSTRERTRWQQYVHADFFNKHKQLRNLCDYILLQAPDFQDRSLEKEKVFRHLFGKDEPYNELKINNLISDLYELLLGFLAFIRREAEPLEQHYQSLMALLDRNLDKQGASELDKFRNLLERRADRTVDWYRWELRFWEAGEILHNRQSRRTAGEHLQRQADAIRNAHLLEKLRLGVAMLNRSTLAVLGSDDNSLWISTLQELSAQRSASANPLTARGYFAAMDLLERPGADTYVALTSILDECYLLFKKEELSALYQCALNYCIRRINDGQQGAYADALALYRTLLDRGILLHNGKLSQWTYKNIATTGLRSGELDWTEQFLHRYRSALLPSERNNAFAFNLATLYFEKQDFTNTLLALQNVEFTDVTYHVGAKILQLKVFYQLGETDALHSLLDATEQWLRRNKSLSSFGKNTNLNFLKVLRQICQWKQKQFAWTRENMEMARLNLILKTTRLQPLANKDWLLKMLAEAVGGKP
ncbi:MAG: hypothetical protein DYG98_12845 [Haliscomenobacteraceae bacterium CHB4]|nr:hypothetical protein [Saprospiraceae bacterium]MCE7923938.1 hypothetical protein [Haliscomenobacteraceae bacterium CHB4]